MADHFTSDIWIPAGCIYTPGFIDTEINTEINTEIKSDQLRPLVSNLIHVEGKLPLEEVEYTLTEIGMKFSIIVRSTKNIPKPTEFDVFDILPYQKELAQVSILYIYSEFSQNLLTDRLFIRNCGLATQSIPTSEFSKNYTLAFDQKQILKQEYAINNNPELYESQLTDIISNYTEMDQTAENYDEFDDPNNMHIQVEVFRIYSDNKFELVGRVYSNRLRETSGDSDYVEESKISNVIEDISNIQFQIHLMVYSGLVDALDFRGGDGGYKYNIESINI